jgi:hypothetical protein
VIKYVVKSCVKKKNKLGNLILTTVDVSQKPKTKKKEEKKPTTKT